MFTKRSELMDKLYGTKESIQVYELLNNLDFRLNEIVQRIAYDYFWALEGLSIRDKSLITVVSLIALGKEQQLRPHITGFLNTGGTVKQLISIFLYFSRVFSLDSARSGFNALCDVLKAKNEKSTVINDIDTFFTNAIHNSMDGSTELHKRDMRMINVASCVAIGDQEKSHSSIERFLSEPECTEADLRNILIHQIIYCGFPSVINGFKALQFVLDNKN